MDYFRDLHRFNSSTVVTKKHFVVTHFTNTTANYLRLI